MTMKASGPIAFLRVPFVLGVLLAAFGPPAALGTLAIAAGLSACGTNSNGPTPGVYPYTVTATDEFSGPTPLGQAVSTTVMVLVP
jgi:hypothetical protein